MGNFEEDDENGEEQLKRKVCDHELNKNARIAREDGEKERRGKDAHDTLECRKLLFALWKLKRMFYEAVELPSVHWLEPFSSFDLEKAKDS